MARRMSSLLLKTSNFSPPLLCKLVLDVLHPGRPGDPHGIPEFGSYPQDGWSLG